jgi:hypothetical protein
MGDICDTVDALLDPSGEDYNLLTSDEKEAKDKSRVSYTDDDKMILRQFEVRVQQRLQKCSQSFFRIGGMLHHMFCLRLEWLFSRPL